MTGLPPATTIRELLERRVVATPEAPAFHIEVAPLRWEALSWRSFAERVAMLRRALWATGLRPGDRLALIAPVSLCWELLHHAALSMGAVIVGLDAHDLPERLAAMAAIADVNAYAVSESRALAAIAPDRLSAAHWVLGLGTEHPTLAGDTRVLDWGELEAAATGVPDKAPRPAGHDLATIIFTSGTTGAPKGIAYRHEQVCVAIDAIGSAFDFVGPGGRLLCWLPLSNLFQRNVNLAAIRNGAATYLLEDPRRVMDVVAGVEPDIFVGVPRFFEKLYDGIRERIAAEPPLRRNLALAAWDAGRHASRLQLEGKRLGLVRRAMTTVADRVVLRRIRKGMGSRLRCMASGSAPLAVHLLEEFHALGWLVLEAYGLSENIMPMAMSRIDGFRFGSVGRPLPANEITIGEGGVVAVRGPGLFSGYLGETGPSPFDNKGYYWTGDFGQFDSDGYLYLTGRTDELIKTSTGRRIAPAGVEAQLRQVTGVDRVVLIGNGRKFVIALCSCEPAMLGGSARIALDAALCERVRTIAEHERPLGIALVGHPFRIEDGELTPNLKLRRRVIEANFEELIERIYRAVEANANNQAERLVVIDAVA